MTLQDRFDIEQVIARYGHVLDTGAEPFSTVFTADAELAIAGVEEATAHGLDAVVRMLTGAPEDPRARPGRPAFSHHTTNVELVHEGDGACGVRSKYFRLGPPGVAVGQYLDTVVRTPDGWRIAKRIVVQHGD